jgi:bifunctional UDP-N-acetylglucosamine pyrophosphorylase/glucosamine-1-phosphate N-acetyltransferase
MDQQLAIIILAAGQGTRMKSAMPKLLHPLAGSPIVAHVLRTAKALDAAHVVAVVRHERDQVAAEVESVLPGIVVVDQDEIPGTGRAVEQAIGALPDDFEGEVLVLNGDVPLLDADTLSAFLEQHRGRAAQASVLSALYEDPTGYGRVVRDEAGAIDRIVEQKDASHNERAIAEVTPASTHSGRAPCATSSRTSRPTTRKARSTSPT